MYTNILIIRKYKYSANVKANVNFYTNIITKGRAIKLGSLLYNTIIAVLLMLLL